MGDFIEFHKEGAVIAINKSSITAVKWVPESGMLQTIEVYGEIIMKDSTAGKELYCLAVIEKFRVHRTHAEKIIKEFCGEKKNVLQQSVELVSAVAQVIIIAVITAAFLYWFFTM